MRPEHLFDEHLAWPVQTPPAVVLARVQERAAYLRRRRMLTVAGAGVPLAVAFVLIALLLPGSPTRSSRVHIRPAVERPGGGLQEDVVETPVAPRHEAGLAPAAEALTAPLTNAGTAPADLPGPFIPSHRSDRGLLGPLGRLVIERGDAIVVLNADGSGERVVASSDAGLNSPDWSPDGAQLTAAHVTRRIVVLDMSGGYRFVSPVGQLASLPKWSPDGSRILYQVQDQTVTGPKTGYRLWTVRPDGTEAHEVVADGKTASWHPGGGQIVYSCAYTAVCAADADGANQRQLPITGDYPAWSPDGSRLAVVQHASQRWVTVAADMSDLRVVDLKGQMPKSLQWSADTGWFVYPHVERAACWTCTTVTSIKAVRVDGSEVRSLTAGPQDDFVVVGAPRA